MDQGAKDFVAGVAAGVALVATGHPFDTVKVKLQAQQASSTGVRYQGALQCTADILRTEGVKGLYKGASSSLMGVAVESSLLFGTYSQLKKALQGPDHKGPPSVATTAAAAAVAGGLVSVVLCPTELIKCRLQVQGGPPIAHPVLGPQAAGTNIQPQAGGTNIQPQAAVTKRARAAATSSPVAVLASSGPRAHSTVAWAQEELLSAGEGRWAQGSPQARLRDIATLPQNANLRALQASQAGCPPLEGPLLGQRHLPRVLGRCLGPGFSFSIPLGSGLGATQQPMEGRPYYGAAQASSLRMHQRLHTMRPPPVVPQYAGPWDCIKKTVQLEGPGGLFKGLTATALRESIGNVCFFVTYESVKRHLTRALEHWTSQQGTTIGSGAAAHAPSVEGQRAGLEGAVKASGVRSAVAEAVTGLVSGGLAGIAFWCAVLPLDVVKTQIQTGTGELGSQAGVLSHLQQLQRQSGLRGLYTGLGPTLWRAFPANAAAVVAWELTARLLGAWGAKT